jgi:hypothetical protein
MTGGVTTLSSCEEQSWRACSIFAGFLRAVKWKISKVYERKLQ